MADGIYYDSSNKQLKLTVSGSSVLTLASGSGVTFANPVTASSLIISSSNSSSIVTITSKDSNSTSKLVFPIHDSASYFMEVMSGSDIGDFRFGLSSSAGTLQGVREAMRCYTGGAYNIIKTSFFANQTEYLSINDSGSISFGNTGSNAYIYITGSRIGINTKNPTTDMELNTNMGVYGNAFISGSLSVGFNSNAVAGAAIQVSGNILPKISASFSLGTSSLEWKEVWAQNPNIQPSDKNIKTNISESILGLDFVNSLKPVSYKFINGSSGRTHYGLIAQEVEEALNQKNINTKDFAGFIKYKKQSLSEEQEIIEVENSGGLKELVTSSYMLLQELPGEQYGYALRYAEFISPLIKSVQELTQKLQQLENKLSSSNI